MNLNLPQCDKLGEFKGLVECYENGKLKWARENKITSIGRLALMSTIVRTKFNPPEGQAWLSQGRWKFQDGSNIGEIPASVCAFAVGDGGTLNDIGIPAASKYTDRGLNSILPLIKRQDVDEPSSILRKQDYIDIYGHVYEEGSSEYAYDTDMLIADHEYFINNTMENDVALPAFKTEDYVFFKRAAQIHRPSFFDMSTCRNTSLVRYKDPSGISSPFNKVYCTVARLELVVSGEELLSAQSNGLSEVDNIAVNELSLYLVAPYSHGDNYVMTSYKSGVEGIEDKFAVKRENFFLPIQFSRVTFPTEIFNSAEKTITFVYSIFV